MGAPILLSFADACGHLGLRALHAKQEQFAFSVSAFSALPSFMLPYFQNWYLPFIFVYVLIPQEKKELEDYRLWLMFIIFMLAFGAGFFNLLLAI